MASLPTVGGSSGTWGTELNTWLLVAHNPDGTLKALSSPPSGLSLPTVGGSSGTWGTELNNWLLVAHNPDGTLKALSSPPSGLSLPTVGGSSGTWGTELNNWLLVAHNADGTLKEVPGGVVGDWVPTPPASYVTSGTVTKQVTVDSGLNTNFVLWTGSRQHIVRTSSGAIFIAYSLNGDGSHFNETWRLKRSNNGGSTWSLVTDSTTAGYPINGGGAPGLEIDENDNIYVVVSQYRASGTDVIFRVYKYSPSNNYASPVSIFSTPLKASNKWGCYWDQSRNWLWMMAWERGLGDNSNDLMAIDGNGTVKVAKKLLGPFDHQAGTTRNADVSYTVLTGTKDGTIIVAWHNEAGSGYIPTFPSGTQSYYDVEFVYSTDGGATFKGPNGTIVGTVIGDDSAPSNRAAYRIVDQTPWATAPHPEFISASDPAYLANGGTHWNLNMLDGLAFNKNALHFYYWAFSTAGIVGPSHHAHARFDWASKAVNRRTQPLQSTTGTALTMAASVGNFVQDTTQASRLYFVGISSNSPAVIYSDDGGTSWKRYALGSSISSPVYTTACRWVQPDGKILAATQSGSSLIFFEVTPDSSQSLNTPIFDGRATRLTQLHGSTEWDSATGQVQVPTVWGELAFMNDDIRLVPDPTYTQVYLCEIGEGSNNPWFNPSNRASGEITIYRPISMGQIDWYASAFMIVSPYTMISGGFNVISQYCYPSLASPPLSISFDSNGLGIDRHVGILRAEGDLGGPGTIITKPRFWPVSSVLDKWVEYIIGVKWQVDTAGEIYVYTRIKANGETGFTLKYSDTTRPTSQRLDGQAVKTTMNDKMGLYFGAQEATMPTNSVKHRGFQRFDNSADAFAWMG